MDHHIISPSELRIARTSSATQHSTKASSVNSKFATVIIVLQIFKWFLFDHRKVPAYIIQLTARRLHKSLPNRQLIPAGSASAIGTANNSPPACGTLRVYQPDHQCDYHSLVPGECYALSLGGRLPCSGDCDDVGISISERQFGASPLLTRIL